MLNTVTVIFLMIMLITVYRVTQQVCLHNVMFWKTPVCEWHVFHIIFVLYYVFSSEREMYYLNDVQ